jgi:protein-tyrosine phosphatase
MIEEPEKILFVCTGNYYRSRFAEILFNHLVSDPHNQLAFSRGFEVFKARNEGPISIYTRNYLTELQIPVDERYPIQITEIDLLIAHRIILLDREEHEPMFNQYFPEVDVEIEYWAFQDIQFKQPHVVLPLIEKQIREMFG